MQANAGKAPPGMLATAAEIVREGGVLGLWKGTSATVRPHRHETRPSYSPYLALLLVPRYLRARDRSACLCRLPGLHLTSTYMCTYKHI